MNVLRPNSGQRGDLWIRWINIFSELNCSKLPPWACPGTFCKPGGCALLFLSRVQLKHMPRVDWQTAPLCEMGPVPVNPRVNSEAGGAWGHPPFNLRLFTHLPPVSSNLPEMAKRSLKCSSCRDASPAVSMLSTLTLTLPTPWTETCQPANHQGQKATCRLSAYASSPSTFFVCESRALNTTVSPWLTD